MERAGVYLEMTDPTQLRPAREVAGLELEEVGAGAAGTVCQLYKEIWADTGGRSGWTPEQWTAELRPESIRTWLAGVGGRPIGFAEVGWQSNGHVGIVVIGVIPEFQGRGFGGDFVTRITRLAWDPPTTRVWLWTVPDEHPATIPNYLARGFRQTERGNEAD